MAFLNYDGLEYFKGKINDEMLPTLKNDVLSDIAPLFSTNTSYSVGDFVIYNGALYRFKTFHSFGEWLGTDVEEVSLAETIEQSVKNTNNLIIPKNIAPVSGSGFATYNVNRNSFTETLGAGTYTVRFKAISTKYSVGNIYFGAYKSTTVNAANRLASMSFRKSGDYNTFTFTVSEEIKAIFIMADVTIALSDGYEVYVSDIQLIRGTAITLGDVNENVTGNDYIARAEINNNKLGSPVVVYDDFTDGYISTTGTSVDPQTIGYETGWYHTIVPCRVGDTFMVCTWGGGSGTLQYVFCDASNNILCKSPTMPTSVNAGRTLAFKAWKKVTAPINSAFMVVHHHNISTNGYNPRVYKMTGSDMGDYLASRVTGDLPYKPINEWENMVVSTYKRSIVINDSGTLKLSTDAGKTWNAGVNVSTLGELVNYHLYADNTLGFFTTAKAYYTSDWSTYIEAPCYEADGTTFIPPHDFAFTPLFDHAERKFINGVDMYVFGNYNRDHDARVFLWYSADNGHSYKVAYEFKIAGSYAARHVHECIYYEPEDVYIVCTGDSLAAEANVLAFEYDTVHDSWSVVRLGGPGADYKWGNIAIYANEIYHTYDRVPGEVWKCKYDDIGDPTKYEAVFRGSVNDAIVIAINRLGEMALIQTNFRSGDAGIPTELTLDEGARVMYYSPDGKTFNQLTLPVNCVNQLVTQVRTLPLLDDGRLFIGTRNNILQDLPSVNIGDLINVAGYRRAFRPM